jgi:hypothetical protein
MFPASEYRDAMDIHKCLAPASGKPSGYISNKPQVAPFVSEITSLIEICLQSSLLDVDFSDDSYPGSAPQTAQFLAALFERCPRLHHLYVPPVICDMSVVQCVQDILAGKGRSPEYLKLSPGAQDAHTAQADHQNRSFLGFLWRTFASEGKLEGTHVATAWKQIVLLDSADWAAWSQLGKCQRLADDAKGALYSVERAIDLALECSGFPLAKLADVRSMWYSRFQSNRISHIAVAAVR